MWARQAPIHQLLWRPLDQHWSCTYAIRCIQAAARAPGQHIFRQWVSQVRSPLSTLQTYIMTTYSSNPTVWFVQMCLDIFRQAEIKVSRLSELSLECPFHYDLINAIRNLRKKRHFLSTCRNYAFFSIKLWACISCSGL